MNSLKCPKDWKPECWCDFMDLEPADDCFHHGAGLDPKICPYCGQFRKRTEACKRCGCYYGLAKDYGIPIQEVI